MATSQQTQNIYTTSTQRLCRWASIVYMLYKCFVFAGISLVVSVPEPWSYSNNFVIVIVCSHSYNKMWSINHLSTGPDNIRFFIYFIRTLSTRF